MFGKRTIHSPRVPVNFRILESVQDDDLEGCVLKIFNECDTSMDQANIEACHCLKLKARRKKVIIKLSKRKDVFNILQRKKKLKSVDITNVGHCVKSVRIRSYPGPYFPQSD